MFEVDPVPELEGPQGLAVHDLLGRVVSVRNESAHHGLVLQTLEEAVRVEVACADLDDAAAEHVRREFDELEQQLADLVRVRARAIHYPCGTRIGVCHRRLRNGSLESRLVVGLCQTPRGTDPNGMALARLLSIRLMLTRHVFAAHRRGWPVPGGTIGVGMVALQRTPSTESTTDPDPDLVARTARVLDRVGGTEFRDLKQAMPVASISHSERAPACDHDARKLFSELVDRYGVHSVPQSRITPALIAMADGAIATHGR